MNKKTLLLLALSSSLMGFAAHAKPAGEPRGDKGERPSVKELFEKFDTDESGTLSAEEIEGPLAEHFDKIDTDDNGELTKKELVIAHKKRQKGEKGEKGPQRGGPKLKEADTNEDGSISKAEATEAGMEKLLEHFDEIDANEDGEITKEEMQAMRKNKGE